MSRSVVTAAAACVAVGLIADRPGASSSSFSDASTAARVFAICFLRASSLPAAFGESTGSIRRRASSSPTTVSANGSSGAMNALRAASASRSLRSDSIRDRSETSSSRAPGESDSGSTALRAASQSE